MVGSYNENDIQLEKYLLSFVLNWKLSYFIPFDFLQIIINEMDNIDSECKKERELIEVKAIQIMELLLIRNLALIP